MEQQVGVRNPRHFAVKSPQSFTIRAAFDSSPGTNRGENITPVTVKYNLTFVIAQPLHAV